MARDDLVYESEPADGDSPEWVANRRQVTACKRCRSEVPTPSPGRQPRCLNPECKNRGVLRAGGRGKRPRRFYFTYADLAAAAGCSEGAIRQRVFRGKLDPSDLKSVAVFLCERIRRG